MRRRKSNAPASHPVPVAVPATARPAPGRPRKSWRPLAVLGLLVVAGWGAWSVWGPDPLGEVRAALDRREFRTADDLLTKRLTERPDDASARLLAARTARRGGNAVRAADHLRKYREAHGEDAEYRFEAALLRAQRGDPAEADRLFAEHVERPESPDTALVMEAYLEAKLKARAGAEMPDATTLAALRRAADLWRRLRPGREDQVQGRLWLAMIHEWAKDHPAGVAALRDVLELDPDHFDARFLLALSLAQADPDESRRHLEILRDQYPGNDYVRFGLATTYRVLGRRADARQLLSGLVDGPTRVSALVELASLDMDEGKAADAEPRLRAALAVAPNSGDVNLAMSRCQQLTGHPAEAAKYRKRFEEIEAARQKQ